MLRSIAFIFFLSFLSNQLNATEIDKKSDVPLKERVYFYQHKLLPHRTHKSDGKFFKDLLNGNYSNLLGSAKRIVSPEYANGISVKKLDQDQGVHGILLVFPEPKEYAEIYYAFVGRYDSNNFYLTFEKTNDKHNTGAVGVVGAWLSNNGRYSDGPRTYEDFTSFVKDAIRIIKNSK